MNKIFKVIWNQSTQSWVAVSELQKSKGKSASKTDKRVAIGSIMALTAITTMSGAYAATNVIAGNTAVTSSNSIVFVETAGSRVVIGNNANGRISGATSAEIPGGAQTVVIGANANSGAVSGNINTGVATGQPGSVVIGFNATGHKADSSQTSHAAYGNKYNDLTTGANVTGTAVAKNGTAVTSSVVVVGRNAEANYGSVAVGDGAYAGEGTNDRALSISVGANAHSYDGGIAIGSSTLSKGVNSFALGRQAAAIGAAAQAFGSASAAVGTGSTAIGHSAQSLGARSIAFGASGSSEAFTEGTVATADDSIAIGTKSSTKAGATSSVVLGHEAEAAANALKSAAIGYNATTSAAETVAIGSESKSAGLGDVAIGANANVALGRNKGVGPQNDISSVAIGYAANATSKMGDVVIGAHASNDFGTAAEKLARTQSTIVGSRSYVVGDQTTALGSDSSAVGHSSVALGGDDITKASSSLQSLAAGLGKSDIAETFRKLATNANQVTRNPDGSETLSGMRLGRMGEFGLDTVREEITGTDAASIRTRNMLNSNTAFDVDNATTAADTQNTKSAYVRTTAVGNVSLAVGSAAQSLGTGSMAVGVNALTFADGASAFGVLARARGKNSIAQGTFTEAETESSVAIGAGSLAGKILTAGGKEVGGKSATALGNSTTAFSEDSIAIGTSAKAGLKSDGSGNVSAKNAIAIGKNAKASALDSIAMGRDSNVTGSQSIAIGVGHQVSGDNSGAFGDPNIVSGNNSYAFGNDNTVSSANAFVLGNNVTTTTDNSVFLGNTAAYVADGATSKGLTAYPSDTFEGTTVAFAGKVAGVVSVGDVDKERRIQNVSPGLISATSTDAINGSQLHSVANSLIKQNYFHVNSATTEKAGNTTNLDTVDGIGGATGGEAIAAGVNATAGGRSAVAMGKGATADSLGNIAIGEDARATTSDKNTGTQDKNASNGINKAIAIGSGSKATNAKTIAIGDQANASGRNSSAIGSAATVTGDESTGIGVAASVTGNFATGIGQRVNATGHQSVAVGTWSRTAADRATAVGRSANAFGARDVALGADSTAMGSHAVTVGTYATTNSDSAVAVGRGAHATSTNATAIGRSAQASAVDSIAMGTGTKTIGTGSVAIGQGAIAGNQVAHKAYMDAYEAKRKEIYDQAANAVNGGADAKKAAGDAAVAANITTILAAAQSAGAAAMAGKTGENAVAIGNGALAEYKDNVVLGAGSRETSETVANPGALAAVNDATVNGITYGGFAASSPTSVVSIGKSGAERRLINVAAGKISNDSTDAINGSQLYMTNQVLGNLANATVSNFGGNATLNKSGDKAGDITFTNIGNTGKDTIHDAIAAVKENVVAGTNIVSVTSQADSTTGATTYTVNAKGTTASSANQNYVTVTPGQPNGENVTDYAVDLSDAAKTSLSKADTAVQSFTTSVNGTQAEVIDQANKDVNFVNGTGTTARNDGGNITFDVNKADLTTNAAGNVTSDKTGDNFVTGDDVANAINEATARTEKTTTVVEGSNTHVQAKEVGNNTEYTVSADKATVSTSAALKLTKTDSAPDANQAVTTDYNIDLSDETKAQIAKEESVVQGDNVTVTEDGTNSTGGKKFKVALNKNLDLGNTGSVTTGNTTVNNDGVKVGNNTLTNAPITVNGNLVTNVNEAINKTAEQAFNPLTFAGDSGTEFNRKLGQKVSVKGGADAAKLSEGNIGVVANGADTLEVKLSKELKELTSAEFKDTAGNTTVINGAGTTITPANGGNTVSLTTTGLNNGGNQITNVASGGDVNTNAANIGDVKKAKTEVKAGTNIVDVVKTEGDNGQDIYTVNAKDTTATHADSSKDFLTVSDAQDKGGNVKNFETALTTRATTALKAAETAVQSFKVAVNGADVQTVANGDTVKFVNGTGTTARNASGQITFDINKSTLTTDAAGNVTNNTAGDTFVTGDDVAKAINEAAERTEKTTTVVKGSNTHVQPKVEGNNTEYTVSADKATVSVSSALTKTETPTTDATTGAVTTDYALDLSQTTKDDIKKGVDAKDIVDNKGLTFTGDSGSTNVEKLGSTVAVNGDTNIATSAQGDQITIKLKDDITVNSVTANATTTTNLTVKPNGNVNMGGNKITNVAAGEADTDAVNVSQLNEKLGNSAWNLKVAQDTGAAANVGDGKINGDNTVTFTGKGAVKVRTKTAATETANYGVDIEVETAQISANTTTGKVGTGDNGAETAPNTNALATAGDVINAVNNSFWKVGLGEGATATKKDDVKAGDTVNFANGTGTTVSVETVDNTTTVKYSIDKGTITSNANTGDVSTPDTTNDKVATTKDVVDAIKGSGFKLIASKAEGGDEEVTTTTEEVINPGEKVEVIAGKNLKVKQEANGKITLSTLDNVNFNNVVVSGNVTAGDTVFNKDGITINNGNTNNKPVTLGKDGLNNGDNKVTGVAKGDVNATSTDAINGSQLHDLIEKGFKVTADNGDADTVKLGETVAYRSASGNIVTTVSDNNINFELANKVTVGDQTNGKPVTIDGTTGTVNGLTNKTWNPNTITSGQAATEDQLKAVSDVANAGWNLTANGQNSSNVAPNDTVDLNNTDGNINISKKEDEDKVTFNLNNTVKLGDTTKNPTGSQLTIDGDKGVISGLNTTLQAVPNTPNPATPVAAPTLTDAQKTQAATLGDVLNAGWNVKGNGEQKDFVQAYDSVDFVNGTGTTAVVTSTDGKATTVKFDINSTTLTQNTDGKAKAGDTNNFATAGNVAEAINKVGLKFSGDVKGATADENTFKRENQDEAKIVGGVTDISKLTDNNIGVVSNGSDTLTVKLAKDITVDSVKAKDNVTVGDGDGATKLTSTTDGLKVEGKDGTAQKITNVAKGTADTDAVNVSQLNDKLAASKWKLQTSQDKGTATDVGEINADDVVVIDGTGAIKVTHTQEAGKTSKVHIAVETAKISTNPDTGKAGTGDNGSTNAPTDTALATAGDVINAVNSVFWKVGQGEGTTAQEKDKVQAGDTVNFANGTGTTVSVETVDNTTTVKYSIDKGTITTDPQTGDVSTPDAANDKVATTKDVVDAIKGSGFKLIASKAEGGDEEVTTTTEEVINPGEKVEVIAGKNLKVKQEANGKITLSTLDNVNFNNVVVSGNVTAGDTVFNKDGITINNGNTNNKPVTLGKDGLNNGDNKVTGVAKGDVNATSTDAINGSQLHDLIEKGFKVTADNGDADTVKLGETVAYRSASGNIVTTVSDNNINFELANKVTVGDQTNGKPVTIDGTTGTVNGLTNKTWNPNTITSGQAATEDQLKAVSDVANAGWNLTANGQNSSNVASGETVDLNNTDKNIVITKNANEDKVTFNLAKDLTVDSVKAGDTTINNDGLKVGENTVTKAPITVNGNTVANINDAINQTAEQAFSPLTFAGDSGNNVERKLGEQVNVKGGVTEATKLSDGNIGVVANGKDTLEVKLAKDIKGIDSISVTNGPTINGDGINMNGDKISNLADGVDDKDAVNVSQLKKAQAAATTKVEGDQGVTVTSKENADGSKTYTVAAKTDDKTITVNKDGNLEAVTSELSNNATTGVVNAPADDKSLVTAKSVADAINNSGFVVTASGNTAGTVKDQLIKTGEKVTLDAGKNLTVTQTDGKFSFATKDDVTFTSVTSNTITVPTDTANPTNNPITINKDGISAGNKTISNVAGNLADASTATSQPDANSLTNLDAKKNNAATVGDVLNAGWNLQGNGTAVDTVTHNDTVDFVNGKGTVVTVEKKDGKNIIKVDSPIEFVNTNTNDTSTPSNTAKLTGANPVQLTNVASGLRQDDGTAPTGKDLADAIKNAAGDTLNNAVNVGDLKAATGAAKTEVKGTGLATVAAPTIGDNGQAIYTVDVAKADAPTVTRGSVTVKAGDENKVMVAGDVAKAITDSEKTSSVKAGSNAVTVTPAAEDANGNTEYTVDVATDKTIARDKDGKLTVNTGSSLKVDGTTGKIDVNTDGTTITTDSTGAVKANTTALTNDDKGKVNTPAVPNALATAGDIANAINNSGFTLKTSANGGSKVSGADEVINPGETIDMAAGKNLTVKQDADGKVTYATSENVTFTSMNSTTVVVGNPADPNNSTTLTSGNGGLNVGGDKITGVADGDITPTSQDAVNGSQIFALTGGAKTTVGDVTVTNPDGSTTTYKNVVLDENGRPALVTYNVKTQGEHITNSVVTAINNMNTQGIKFFHTNDGKADSTRPSDQRYNSEDSSASGRYASAVGYQAEASGESSVAMGNNATASGANAIAIGVNSQATGKNTISVGNGNIVTGENSGAFGDPSKIDATNSYSVGNNNEIAVGQTDVFALGNNVKATASNSVFLGSESGVFDQANANRNANTGVHTKTANSNYTYKGENDANVAGVNNAVGVVSVGNAKSTRQVQGVAAGVVSETSTDAINGSQLYYTNKAIGDLKGDVYKLGDIVNKNNRQLRAGIAGTNAAASLPQVYIPGKSMVAAAAGTFKGESALAVGYSRASDNGKVILKLQGNANTRGDFGAGVGVGYQW